MGKRITGLDALRGLAALVVLLFHIDLASNDWNSSNRGYLAVDFFFLLSGYVLSRTYGNRMSGFLWIRLKRLYPTMFAAAVLALPLLFLQDLNANGLMVLSHLLIVPYFAGVVLYPLNGAAWSIFFEYFANIWHAAFYSRVRISFLAFAAASSLAFLTYLAAPLNTFDVGSKSTTFVGGFMRVIFSYTLGVLLWKTFGDRPPFRLPALFTIALLPTVSLASSYVDSWMFDFVFITIVSPVLLIGGLSFQANALGSWLGKISFPLYAFHMPVLVMAKVLDVNLLIAALCAIFLAYAFTFLTERRLNRRRSLAVSPSS